VLFTPTVVAARPFLAALTVLPEGEADPAQEAEPTEVVERAHVEAAVFVAADVQDRVQPVLDAPFLPPGLEEGRGGNRPVGRLVARQSSVSLVCPFSVR
jgi:hypothetical protein